MTKGHALITADIHLATNPRDHYRLNYMKRVASLLQRGDYDSFCILGDLTEAKDWHHSWLVNEIANWIVDCAKHADVTILLGNHDYTDRAHPFFAFLGHYPRVHFITEPGVFKIHGIGIVTCLPHTRNYEKDWAETLASEAHHNAALVFAHQTFDGARAANGKKLEGIPGSIFGGKPVIAGDIHAPQKIGRIEYVGSPYRIDFGDEWDGRMIRFLNGKRVADQPCVTPQKRMIMVRSPAGIRNAKFNRGDILKVVCDAEAGKPWAQVADEVRKAVDAAGAFAHSIVPSEVIRQPAAGKRVAVKYKSDEQVVDEFGKRVGVDQRVIKTGKFIMGKA